MVLCDVMRQLGIVLMVASLGTSGVNVNIYVILTIVSNVTVDCRECIVLAVIKGFIGTRIVCHAARIVRVGTRNVIPKQGSVRMVVWRVIMARNVILFAAKIAWIKIVASMEPVRTAARLITMETVVTEIVQFIVKHLVRISLKDCVVNANPAGMAQSVRANAVSTVDVLIRIIISTATKARASVLTAVREDVGVRRATNCATKTAMQALVHSPRGSARAARNGGTGRAANKNAILIVCFSPLPMTAHVMN